MIAPVLQNNLLLLSQVTALMAYSQESHTIGSILNSIMTLQWARLTSLNDSGKAFDNDCKPPLKPDPSPKQPPCNNPESLQEPPCQGKPHQRIPMKSVIFLARYGTIAPNVLSTVPVSLITLPPCTPMLLIWSNFSKVNYRDFKTFCAAICKHPELATQIATPKQLCSSCNQSTPCNVSASAPPCQPQANLAVTTVNPINDLQACHETAAVHLNEAHVCFNEAWVCLAQLRQTAPILRSFWQHFFHQ